MEGSYLDVSGDLNMLIKAVQEAFYSESKTKEIIYLFLCLFFDFEFLLFLFSFWSTGKAKWWRDTDLSTIQVYVHCSKS